MSVCQGGVLSAILYCLYVEGLLQELGKADMDVGSMEGIMESLVTLPDDSNVRDVEHMSGVCTQT